MINSGHEKLSFTSDYTCGAHPDILKALIETNGERTPGYGADKHCSAAADFIRSACGRPSAEVYFLSGGTQANSVVISSLLRPYQGVITADCGHINAHEAGAIEYGGHKVMLVPHSNGKLTAASVEKTIDLYNGDENKAHMVMPGMVYISHPSEYGTVYSLKELEELSSVCRKNGIYLYLDGARLAYALACEGNDVTLADIARLCDVFYIGGTKCGAMFGEAVVITKEGLIPHFFTQIKQRGALLAKGRFAGIQFETLFRDGLYFNIGRSAVSAANKLRRIFAEKGYELFMSNPTNQVFVILENERMEELGRNVDFGFWEKYGDSHTVVRFATDWATTDDNLKILAELL